jgi:hypothetical protein
VHGLSVEHGDNCSMAGAHGRQGAWERARRDNAGWGAVLVRALIVRMPLVRGTLARHHGGNARVSREGCVASKAVHRERQRGGRPMGVPGVALVGMVQSGISTASAKSVWGDWGRKQSAANRWVRSP